MKRFLLLAALAALALALAAPCPAADFKLGPHTFTLPDGFTIEVAAPSSLVPRPIEADFDEQGRLYVTDSSGSNDKVTQQLADKPHRVLRLEDTDGNGTFDKQVVFADKMMFPEGALWHDGSLYVSAPPSIWKLTDTNSDGVADVRAEWFKGQSLGGCANDLHGPYLGPDGWIYWCKGGFEKQTHTLGNGKTFTSRASHIWRARPDGTGLEPIMTGGHGQSRRAGLVGRGRTLPQRHVLSASRRRQARRPHPRHPRRRYGKDHEVLEGHPRTGDLLPIMTHLGPAAPVGLARYESSVFGPEYQDNLFLCQFNLHKVSRHILQETGATYVTRDSDFLVSNNTDFHPTDVFEDADGSLLVIDTGGWYKLCCPTSQLPKPDVLGAIYRVRRAGAPKVNDPRGLKLAWATRSPEQLVALLEDPRPAVASLSIDKLGVAGNDAVVAIATARFSSRNARLNAQKALARNTSPGAPPVLALVAKTQAWDTSWRHAVRELGRRDAGSLTNWAYDLLGGNAGICCAVVEALGRIGDANFVPILLHRAGHEPDGHVGKQGPAESPTPFSHLRHRIPTISTPDSDRILEHSIIRALIDIGAAGKTAAGLASSNPWTHRAALIALDQMPGGNLTPAQVTPLLGSTNALLKQTANWIVSHRPEWAGALATWFQERLPAPLSDPERAELESQLAQFARDPSIQTLLAGASCSDNSSREARLSALRAMGRSRLKETPAAWSRELAHSLEGSDITLLREVVATARALPAPKQGAAELTVGLMRAAANPLLGPGARLDALAAIPGGLAQVESATFDFLLAQLTPDKSVALRGSAAGVLARARLTAAQLSALAGVLSGVGPLELTRLLSAFARANDEGLGLKLIASLQEAKALSSLHPDTLRPSLTNFPASVRTKADALLARLNPDAARQNARLDELSLNLKSGDVRRGQAIFNSQKAACSACHAIGYLGGTLGPDLTKIGQVRTERDLLEAVVLPSASFVRSYEPMLVVTRSGDEHSGVLRRDAPDEVVLGTGVNAEVRVARAEIAEMRPGTVSVMPSGLDEQLTRQELADLLAFLKATKW